jgi:hypothetical protein
MRQQVIGASIPEHSARRFTDRRARCGDDVGFLDLFAHGDPLDVRNIPAGRKTIRPNNLVRNIIMLA